MREGQVWTCDPFVMSHQHLAVATSCTLAAPSACTGTSCGQVVRQARDETVSFLMWFWPEPSLTLSHVSLPFLFPGFKIVMPGTAENMWAI